MERGERFEGFGSQTRRFLAGIAANNEKAWFDAHRDDYERHYVAPALAFIRQIAPRLKQIAPQLSAEPKINGSLLRINHDMRFSKDRQPYKDRLDLWFWEGAKRGWDRPGLFMRLTATSLILGAGMRRFEGPQLDAYRVSVVGPAGETLATLLDRLTVAGYETSGATRKRVPPGLDPDHSRAHLLLHGALSVVLAEPVPDACATREFVDYCARHFAALAPLNDWLRGAMLTSSIDQPPVAPNCGRRSRTAAAPAAG